MRRRKRNKAVRPATPTKNDAAKKREENASLVDTVFDTGTAWAARALEATKGLLEDAARSLDHAAKVVGDLASSLVKEEKTAS